MRTFDTEPGVDSPHEPVGAVDGFPPPSRYAPDFLRDAIGYPVSVLCSNIAPVTYTELLVGFAATGPEGGGWLGIDVGYSVGGHHHTVSLDYDTLVCGTAIDERCPGTPLTPAAWSPGRS
jgi:hypothetical protein